MAAFNLASKMAVKLLFQYNYIEFSDLLDLLWLHTTQRAFHLPDISFIVDDK